MKLLRSFFAIIAVLGLNHAHAQFAGIGPEYNVVRDVIFTDDTGTISLEIPYLDGQESQRRIKFASDSGSTIEFVFFPDFPSGPAPITLITPDDTFTFTQLSSTSVRVRNLNTGQSWTKTSSSPPDALGVLNLNLPSPSTTWQQEIKDLVIAYEAFVSSSTVAVSHPLKWYEEAGFITVDSPLPSCVQGPDCGEDLAQAALSLAITTVGCFAAGGPVGLTLCGVAIVGSSIAAASTVNSCECVPYETPPSSTPVNGGSVVPCVGDVCSNFNPPSVGSCQCSLMLVQPGYVDRCLEYSCQP